jgi:hypothetical protein
MLIVTPDGCWTFRMTNADGVAVPHAPVSAHSLVWPGATAVARRNTFVNVYIGWGLKYSSQPYTPPPPPAIQTEFVAEFNPEDGETDPLTEQVIYYFKSFPFHHCRIVVSFLLNPWDVVVWCGVVWCGVV